MKKIIVPVDFSSVSNNAVTFAMNLATDFGASVTLVHIYSIPVPTIDISLPIVPIQELEEAANFKMNKYLDELSLIWPLIEINRYVSGGFIIDEITNYCNTHPSDLIIAGISGGGKFKEKIIGSNAMELIKSGIQNIFIIPSDAKYSKPKNIVFATDYTGINEKEIAAQLRPFLEKFRSNLDILNIISSENVLNPEMAASGIRLHQSLENYNHGFKMKESADVATGIETYVNEHSVDWLVIYPKKHSFFESLLQESITKKLAFHLHIPIFAVNKKLVK